MKKIFIVGFEIDLDNLSKCQKLEKMTDSERKDAYYEEENPGGVYTLRDFFDALNNDEIDTENYIWLPIEQ